MADRSRRILEIRRHAKRHKPGDNLSAEGVARARRASACERSYARVVTSQVPRAIQSAIAMGHAVDEEDWTMASMGPLVSRVITLGASFADIQHAIRTDPAAALYADLQARQLCGHLDQVHPGEAVLVVSHGGVAEAGVLGLVPDIDGDRLGHGLDYCEGARLELDGDRCLRIELLRFDVDDRETVREITLG